MRFVDTNIPIYAFSSQSVDQLKQRVSQEILAQEEGNLAVSAQVLGELYSQMTRGSRSGALTHEEASTFIRLLQRNHVEPLTQETVGIALQYRERFALSYWDCLILAAAKQSGCDAVYSEDMSSNQDYDGIRIINPFVAESEPAGSGS